MLVDSIHAELWTRGSAGQDPEGLSEAAPPHPLRSGAVEGRLSCRGVGGRLGGPRVHVCWWTLCGAGRGLSMTPIQLKAAK